MTSITGSTAPLHRRFDEQDALRQIRSRYLGMQEDITEQVKVLQADGRFLARCQVFYKKGYKDWHILAAILNRMLYILQRELGCQFRSKKEIEQFKDLPKQLKGKIYPVEEFLTPALDFMFVTHALTCLSRMGFEERAWLKTEPAMRFLRERMRHFDLDVPHPPMFGKPANGWPKL